MTEAMIAEYIEKKVCPHCHAPNLSVESDYISCRVCDMHGNPEAMRWCIRVPMFMPADPTVYHGQLYEHHDEYWRLAGYAPGCWREVKGEYCVSCRGFLPFMVNHAERKSRARPARA